MNELNLKILENENKIFEHDKQISRIRKKNKILENVDKVLVGIFILSGISAFFVTPIAFVPCLCSLGGSVWIEVKQKKYKMELNCLTVKRGRLFTENGKLKWEIQNLEKDNTQDISLNDTCEQIETLNHDETISSDMTTGISKKPLVKTRISN